MLQPWLPFFAFCWPPLTFQWDVLSNGLSVRMWLLLKQGPGAFVHCQVWRGAWGRKPARSREAWAHRMKPKPLWVSRRHAVDCREQQTSPLLAGGFVRLFGIFVRPKEFLLWTVLLPRMLFACFLFLFCTASFSTEKNHTCVTGNCVSKWKRFRIIIGFFFLRRQSSPMRNFKNN